MKKIIRVGTVLAIIGCILWFASGSVVVNMLFNPHFSDPIFSERFDVSKSGTIVKGTLNPRFRTTHAFKLVFPAAPDLILKQVILDGKLSYRFSTNGQVLLAGQMAPPKETMDLWYQNEKSIVLFFLDLPFHYWSAVGDLEFEVSLDESIDNLKWINDKVRFEVSPYFMP